MLVLLVLVQASQLRPGLALYRCTAVFAGASTHLGHTAFQPSVNVGKSETNNFIGDPNVGDSLRMVFGAAQPNPAAADAQ